MSKVVKVLSIDGGGIQVICAAIILSEIEKKTGKPIAKLFDLIAGTSAGAVLTLGLIIPGEDGQTPLYNAEEGVRLYTTQGPTIFSRSLFHKVRALGNLLDEKYESDGVEQVFTTFFKRTPLSHALTNVLITSYDIKQREAFFFKSKKARLGSQKNFYLKDIARGATAAPTFFEPAYIHSIDRSEVHTLVDGAVFANNPAMCAYAEIKSMYPDPVDILLLSLGTGGKQKSYTFEQAKNWGALQWILPAIDVIFDGIGDTIDYQLRHIFMTHQSHRSSYTRFTIPNERSAASIDDFSAENIHYLTKLTHTFIQDNRKQFETLYKQLTI